MASLPGNPVINGKLLAVVMHPHKALPQSVMVVSRLARCVMAGGGCGFSGGKWRLSATA